MNNEARGWTSRLTQALRKPSLRVTIATIFSLLFVVATLIILVYTYVSNSRSVLEVGKSLLEENAEAVLVKTTNHLRPAAQVAELNAFLASRGIVALENRETFKRLCAAHLRAHPQLREVNFGSVAGNIFGAERRDKGVINLYQILRKTPDETSAWLRYEFIDASGKTLEVKEHARDYDPRLRPWYRGAVRSEGTFWTDPYVFITDKMQVGITAAHPLYTGDGDLAGVMSCDVELEALSAFLRGLRVGQNGFGMLVNREGGIVCHPDTEKAVVEEGDGVRTRNLEEMGLPWLAAALDRAAREGESTIRVAEAGEKGPHIVSLRALPGKGRPDWNIVLAAPEEDFVGELRSTNRVVVIFAAVTVLVAVLAITVFSRRISKPLETLTRETDRLRELDLEKDIEIRSHIVEIDHISTAMARLKTALRAFEKYVPATLVKQLIERGEEARIGGTLKTLTIFFSDIASFTTLAESVPPRVMMIHLSEYLDELTHIILDCRGTVDKYIGDGIMAFWGAPAPNEIHTADACRAAVLCQRRLEALNARWSEEGKPTLPTRIGVHTGETIVGNLGSRERMNYSLLGDSVNLAARLEGVNKVYGTRILVSETTCEGLDGTFVTRPLDYVVVKGKKRRVKIYELLDLKDDQADPGRIDLAARFTEAFDRYHDREWDAALTILEGILRDFPRDEPALRLANRCKSFKEEPPEERTWCERLDGK